jgi:hypothetical protein
MPRARRMFLIWSNPPTAMFKSQAGAYIPAMDLHLSDDEATCLTRLVRKNAGRRPLSDVAEAPAAALHPREAQSAAWPAGCAERGRPVSCRREQAPAANEPIASHGVGER